MNMLNSIRPNILLLAILAVGLAGYMGSEPLAAVVISALATTMYLLGGPPPNPMVSKDFALAVTLGKTVDMKTNNLREQVVLYLVSIAATMTVVMSWFSLMPDTVTEIAVAGIIGVIGSAIGSMLEPSDEASVPQSTLFKYWDLNHKK